MSTASPGTSDYRIIDADHHYYEPDDCFTRHIESRYRDQTVWVNRNTGKPFGQPQLGAERLHFFSVAVGDFVGAPGSMKDFFKGKQDRGAVNLNGQNAYEVPEYTDRNARVRQMDTQNVEACIMLPTLGVGVEPHLRHTPDLLYPTLRAFNRWVEEDWGFGADGRIFASAILSLWDLDEALLELDRLITLGCKTVVLTPGPVRGKSPADPCFDPFWGRCQEAGVGVIYHICASGFLELYGVHWGERAHAPSHRHSALENFLALGERPIFDTLAALFCHNLFGRFPKLRIISIENGGMWIPHLLKKLDGTYRMDENANKDLWRFGRPPQNATTTFRENFFVAPYYEDDMAYIAKALGTGNILNGSDFPHPEGLLWPAEFADELTAFSAADQRKIMRDNCARLLGLQ